LASDSPDLIARIREQFAARHRDYDRSSNWATDPALLSAMVAALDPGRRQVLEVCCGTALVGAALTDAGAHVVATDVSPEMLEAAVGRVAEVHLADAHALPFPDGSFARLALRQAWHFLDPLAVAAELFRVACPGAVLVTAQTLPFGDEDREHLERSHRAKQRDLTWFPTEPSLVQALERAGWRVIGREEVLIEEELGAWLRFAPEAGDRAAEVVRLVREAPAAYRRLHRVREDEAGLHDTFRWVVLTCERPGPPPGVAPDLLPLLRCPACRHHPLEERPSWLRCPGCGAEWLVDAGVPQMSG
jgi:DNA gyrase subunit B